MDTNAKNTTMTQLYQTLKDLELGRISADHAELLITTALKEENIIKILKKNSYNTFIPGQGRHRILNENNFSKTAQQILNQLQSYPKKPKSKNANK